MDQIIFHIDVNSAFLSWTALNALSQGSDIDLRGIPSIVGGDIEKRHGVVLAKSIETKKYGIKTGEPIVNALRKCPNLVIVPPKMSLYEEYSKNLMEFLSHICPDIEQLSIDECFMNYTPIAKNYSSPESAATIIKDEIFNHFGFSVNIGISNCKVLAKMASDFKKPNLVHTLYREEIKQKLWPLPVSELYMCGKSSAETLRKLGIITIKDLATANLSILESHLKSHGLLLYNYANGIDDSCINLVEPELKGIGNSTTLAKDAEKKEEVYKILLQLSETVASRLRSENKLAGMVSIEIKYSDFQSVSHQTTLYTASDSTDFIYKTACSLFDQLWNQNPVRLLGIRTSKLIATGEPLQISIFDFHKNENTQASIKQQKLDQTLDSIRDKYGKNAIIRGSLLPYHEK